METKKPEKRKIRSFRDLDVYQSSYACSIEIHRKILPKLPGNEKWDLKDQLLRASKAVPRLIAEGFAKKHQRAGFQKYFDDAMVEANETGVCLDRVKDIYDIEVEFCTVFVDRYDKIGRQLFLLSEAWDKFKNKRRITDND